MKKLLVLMVFVGTTAIAQVKGNGNIETRGFPATNLTDLEIGLYADILIDPSKPEGFRITTDSNLFDLIDTEVVDGTLKLDQDEWIQASKRMKIVIGGPNIKRVQQGTNAMVRIINLDTKTFNAVALNGTILISGKTDILGVGAENGWVDAGQTKAKEVFLNIWGHGKAVIDPIDLLDAKLSKEASLELIGQPKRIKGNIKNALSNANSVTNGTIRYISFKIKNNSNNRNNFYVIGPKPDGRNFSYGFPMMPGKVRKEKWTTGTKVYKVNPLGLKKLLVTIKATDEDTIVELF
ncbi:hypothetical protein FK220_011985 [Flavobacteriaceae bacterium TP-CH-4]|uniref:Putative auto-transporter adhesin head GIN domain-containing protein n=1 Tax=Pelagihabitans pacificus TaxID=2696054 RepID=A0A967AUA3_9FLAO|nr:DUF2807 domain-containing protein [Pelagihabitans pacificus]NHF60067.1 hypothetical protein [Pelagihabitans pacificus]